MIVALVGMMLMATVAVNAQQKGLKRVYNEEVILSNRLTKRLSKPRRTASLSSVRWEATGVRGVCDLLISSLKMPTSANSLTTTLSIST